MKVLSNNSELVGFMSMLVEIVVCYSMVMFIVKSISGLGFLSQSKSLVFVIKMIHFSPSIKGDFDFNR